MRQTLKVALVRRLPPPPRSKHEKHNVADSTTRTGRFRLNALAKTGVAFVSSADWRQGGWIEEARNTTQMVFGDGLASTKSFLAC